MGHPLEVGEGAGDVSGASARMLEISLGWVIRPVTAARSAGRPDRASNEAQWADGGDATSCGGACQLEGGRPRPAADRARTDLGQGRTWS